MPEKSKHHKIEEKGLKVKVSKKMLITASIIIIVVIAGYLVLYNQNTKQGDVTFVNIIKNYIGIQNTAKQGDLVYVNYVVSINSTIFDTNIETVARAAGIYDSSKAYEPMLIQIGAGKYIKGFEDALYGMKEGEEKTAIIPPELGYGQWDPSKVVSIQKSIVNNSQNIGVGALLTDNKGAILKVLAINDTNIVIDTNNMLAGKTLAFDITLVRIKNA